MIFSLFKCQVGDFFYWVGNDTALGLFMCMVSVGSRSVEVPVGSVDTALGVFVCMVSVGSLSVGIPVGGAF